VDLRDLRGSILPRVAMVSHRWTTEESYQRTGAAASLSRPPWGLQSRSVIPTERTIRSRTPFLSAGHGNNETAFLTFGFLALAFVGLWQTIPINAAHVTARASLPDPSKAIVNSSTGLAKNVSEHAPTAKASSTKRRRRTSLSGRVPSNSPMVVQTLLEAARSPQVLQQSLPSTLRISVEHHFGTAHLSVWIDEK
jgi:hypothetical protein